MSASHEDRLHHPLWPWIIVLASFCVIGLGLVFVLSWVLLEVGPAQARGLDAVTALPDKPPV
ncbi:hypothetical protein X265_12510 [Bradyrhizobium guangdongense]|nr:hypothetical protein X265_12510 [Bradyrhizobium guangdongense]